jgi:hypothetical protein
MKRLALLTLLASVLAVGAGYGTAFLPGGVPPWGEWLFMLGTVTTLVSMMALGAARHGRIGVLALPFGLVFGILTVGFGTALALADPDPLDPVLWLGLPPRAAIIMYGIGLVPILLVPLVYALTFERQTLSEDDWRRVREAGAAWKAANGDADEKVRP